MTKVENNHVHHRWTPHELALLDAAVQSSDKIKDAFVKVGEATNRAPGTVQAKYYMMRRQSKPAKRPAVRPAVSVKTAPSASKASKPINLAQMSTDDLVQAAALVHAEIETRIAQNANESKMLHSVRP